MLPEAPGPIPHHAELPQRLSGALELSVHVMVLPGVLGQDVELAGVHVAQVGIETRRIEPHPHGVAVVVTAQWVAHDPDVCQRR